jgi:hypothetical protein
MGLMRQTALGTYAGFVQVVYGQDKVEEFFSNPEKPDVLVGMQVGRQYKLKQDS